MDIEKEQWFDRIRSFAPKVKQAHEELARAEAEVKKVEAVLMTEAMLSLIHISEPTRPY